MILLAISCVLLSAAIVSFFHSDFAGAVILGVCGIGALIGSPR